MLRKKRAKDKEEREKAEEEDPLMRFAWKME